MPAASAGNRAGAEAALQAQSAQEACGSGASYCGGALASEYNAGLRADPCSVVTSGELDERREQYVLWMPTYRKGRCQGSGHVSCTAAADRFGPRQVTQESFLQGRGQVSSQRVHEALDVV